MRTKVLLVVAALLMAIVSTVAIGSNMGFKISIEFQPGVPKFVSLPYYVSLNGNLSPTASDLVADTLAAGTATCEVYNWNGSDWEYYTDGGFGQVDFSLVPGRGYQLTVSDNINWIVVGSHNPTTSIPLSPVPLILGLPYHKTATTASELVSEILADGAPSVELYNWNGNDWEYYTDGGFGQVDFTVVPGIAYQVSTASSLSYTPSHF